jgi:hypothetical protein
VRRRSNGSRAPEALLAPMVFTAPVRSLEPSRLTPQGPSPNPS